jgi:hypothetical protein
MVGFLRLEYDTNDYNMMEDLISAIRTSTSIDVLYCSFDEETFNMPQKLRDVILNKNTLEKIKLFGIGNLCLNRETYNLSLNFFLRCLEEAQNKTTGFCYYSEHIPLTLPEAKRFATSIKSNGSSIRLLSFEDRGRSDLLFSEEGTFECIFNAVLDGGVDHLSFHFRSSSDIVVKRVCLASNLNKLVTNTTLKELHINTCTYRTTEAGVTDDEKMTKLANVLKVNMGLETIKIPHVLMTNTGRSYLLDSLRDNTTLSTLDTIVINYDLKKTDKKEKEKRNFLQSQIDHHMMLNRIWKRCNKNNENNNNNNRTTISIDIYPDLLEKLAKKPLLIFLFLQKGLSQLFSSFYERSQKRQQQQRRRSMRIMKKRRMMQAVGEGE